MSTISRLRRARMRASYGRLTKTLGSLVLAVVIMSPLATKAQNNTGQPVDALGKSEASTSDAARHLKLAQVYGASVQTTTTHSERLHHYEDWQRTLSHHRSSSMGGHVSKGNSTLFEDMQMIPGQTFENSNGYGGHALIALPDDVIGIAYTDQGIGKSIFDPAEIPPRILYRTSSDGGATWTDPVVVGDDAAYPADHQWVSIAMTNANRLVIIDESPNFGQVEGSNNFAYYSDDMGTSWSPIDYEETDWLDRVLGPVNGQLWLQAGAPAYFEPQTAVEYITSTDGIVWSDVQTMIGSLPAGVDELSLSDITQTGASSYLATFETYSYNNGDAGLATSRSTDNGATWSPVVSFDLGDILNARSPRVDSDGSGTVHMVFVGVPNENSYGSDIFVAMSSDGGATFGTPEAFTRYLGEDYNADLALASGRPLAVFQSYRFGDGYGSVLWRGQPGVTPDLDPPPVIFYESFPGAWIPADVEFQTPLIRIADESGVAGAEVAVTRDGSTSYVPLYDDGAHGDLEAGDGIFGGSAGPFSYGSDLAFEPIGTDDGGNTASAFMTTARVSALHDVGRLSLVVTPEGAMGYEPLQAYDTPIAGMEFPKGSGQSFAAYAGLWVGINKSPGPRVSHLYYDNMFDEDFRASATFGDWQVTEFPTAAPGESERDIVMHYDDSGAPHPLGIGVKQTTYQWSDANYVIFDFDITNESSEDLQDVYVAMALDPDVRVGSDAYDDQTGYDGDRALLYAFDSGDWCTEFAPGLCTDTHIGLALISDGSAQVGKSAPIPQTAQRWNIDSDEEPFRTVAGLDVDMYELMTSGFWPGFNLGLKSSASEWRIVLTAQPINLPAGASARFVYGIVAGAGEAGIQASTDNMISRFENAVLAVEQTGTVPSEFALGQNYPNPFNPSTTIPFSVTSTSPVSITVFDVLGRQVDRIVDQTLSAGSYTATFESSSLPSGAYYYTLTADGQSITKSMFLLK